RAAGTHSLRSLKLFCNFVGRERVIDAITAVAQLLNLFERVGSALLLGNDNIDVDLVLLIDGRVQFLAGRCKIAKLFAEDHVAHGETERRHRDRAVAELPDIFVVASDTGYRSQYSGAIEGFEI